MNLLSERRHCLYCLLLLVLPFTAFGQLGEKDDISTHHHKEYLLQMVEMSIMKGYGNGIYKPDGNVTRGQFAIMMTRALHLELPDEGIVLSDVTDDEILAAAGAELITGYGDGTFKPNNNISTRTCGGNR